MTKILNHSREVRVRSGHCCEAVKKACKVLKQALDGTALVRLLDEVQKYAKPRFLEWFNNVVESLGLNRKIRQEVLAIVG